MEEMFFKAPFSCKYFFFSLKKYEIRRGKIRDYIIFIQNTNVKHLNTFLML